MSVTILSEKEIAVLAGFGSEMPEDRVRNAKSLIEANVMSWNRRYAGDVMDVDEARDDFVMAAWEMESAAGDEVDAEDVPE